MRHKTRIAGGVLAGAGVGLGAIGWPGLGLDPAAGAALSIMLVAAALWICETVPLFATSLLVLAMSLLWAAPAMQGVGIDAQAQEFTGLFFSDVILLFLGGFTLSAAMHKHGLDGWIAQRVLRLGRGRLWLLVAWIMVITAGLSMWLSNTATAAMMLALCLPVARSLPSGAPSRRAIILAIPLAANLGGMGTPIGTPPNAVAMGILSRGGAGIGFHEWLMIGLPAAGGMLVVAWLVVMLMHGGFSKGASEALRTDFDSPASRPTPEASWRTTLMLTVAGLTVLGWITSAWHGLSPGIVALVPVVVLFATGDLTDRNFRELPWDVLVLMGGGLCLGAVVERSGLASEIVSALPIGALGPVGVIAVFAVCGFALSSLMSNTAAANLLLPIAIGAAAASGDSGDGRLAAIGIAFSCSLAMALPVSTPPNAIAFASGELRSRDMVVPGLVIGVIGLALTLTVGLWWQRLLGLG